jgi:hypothetical protein
MQTTDLLATWERSLQPYPAGRRQPLEYSAHSQLELARGGSAVGWQVTLGSRQGAGLVMK